MEIRVLKYFITVANEENITKAANLLHITQPTLSRQLANLEEELDVPLFIRVGQGIKLTKEGILLKERALQILALTSKTEDEIRHANKEITGTISIGCGELQAFDLIAKKINEFRKKYPKVKFEIFSGNADSVKEKLELGLLDIGIVFEPVEYQKYDYKYINKVEEYGFLVHEESNLSKKYFLEPSDIFDEELIVPSRKEVVNVLNKWTSPYNCNEKIIATFNLPYNGAMLVKNKIGIAYTVKLDCSYDNVVFVPMKNDFNNRPVVIWKKTVLCETYNKFIKML